MQNLDFVSPSSLSLSQSLNLPSFRLLFGYPLPVQTSFKYRPVSFVRELLTAHFVFL